MAQGKVNFAHELVNKASSYSAGNILERGGQALKDWITTHKPSKVNKALSDNKQQLIADIEKYTSRKPNVFGMGCFDRDVLSNLNEKQLKALGTFVSKIDYLDERSASHLSNGDPYLASQNEELRDIYKSALEEMSPYFEGANIAKMFGADTIKSDINQLNSNIPTPADLQLVEAFKRIGVNLSLHVNGASIKWEYDQPKKLDPNADRSAQLEEMFRFNEQEVKAFTQGYLDKPLNERNGKVITPDGLFRVYKERGQNIIGDRHKNGQITDNERNMLLADFQTKCHGNTTKDSNWEMGLLTSQEYIVKTAQSLALQEIAHDTLGAYSNGGVLDIQSEFQEKLNENKLYNTMPDRRDILGNLSSQCTASADIIQNNVMASGLPDIESRYDNLISTLENRQKTLLDGVADPVALGKIEGQIELLKASKENLLINVEFMKNFAMQNAGNADKGQIMNDLQFSSERYWVNSNNGGFEVVDRHSGVINANNIGASANKQRAQDALANAIKARVLAKSKSGEVNTADLDEKTKASVQKMYDSGLLTYLIENQDGALGFADSMNDMYKLKVSEILFEDGNPFDVMANDYFAKNPGKSFNDFVSEQLPMADEKDGFFDRKSLLAAYESRQVEKGEKDKVSDASANHINGVNEKYGESLVIMDRVLNSLTPEELANFHDPTYPSSAKSALINQKVIEAKRAPISATNGNKEYESAKAKYNNGVLANLLSTNLDDIKDMESETMTNGAISNILQKYINQLAPQAGASASAPIQQKDKYVKYGDLRQKTVDLIKFEKAMKGYSSKELKKKFIKPLLAALKGKVMLNVSAYERNKQALQGGQPKFKQPDPPKDPGRPVDDQSLDPNDNQNQQPPQQPPQNPQNPQPQNPQPQNPSNPLDNSNQNSAQTQPQKKNLRKRELEASAFLPASCMIDKVIADVTKNQGPTAPNLGGLNDLKQAFTCLSSIDNLGNDYSKQLPDGTDFRDACRNIAFDICKGVLKDPKDVQDRLTDAVNTYNIPQSDFLNNLQNGFRSLTPELMNYLFDFSSDSKMVQNASGNQVNKLTLGSKLPRGLDACKTDAERQALIKNYMEKNLINYNEGTQLLDMLVNDIYLQQGASSGFNRQGDDMEFEEM